jgi:hypothetical protein
MVTLSPQQLDQLQKQYAKTDLPMLRKLLHFMERNRGVWTPESHKSLRDLIYAEISGRQTKKGR